MATHYLYPKTSGFGWIRYRASLSDYTRFTTGNITIQQVSTSGGTTGRIFHYSDPAAKVGRTCFKASFDFHTHKTAGTGLVYLTDMVGPNNPLTGTDQSLFAAAAGTLCASYDMVTQEGLDVLLDLGTNGVDAVTNALLNQPSDLAIGMKLGVEAATKNLFITSGAIAGGPVVVLELDAVVSTTQPYKITQTTAVVGGTCNDDGGAAGGIIERGVVYATHTAPTVLDSEKQMGTGEGTFSNTITGLTGGTTYYVRAYVITAWGVFYGSEYTLRTRPRKSRRWLYRQARTLLTRPFRIASRS